MSLIVPFKCTPRLEEECSVTEEPRMREEPKAAYTARGRRPRNIAVNEHLCPGPLSVATV